VGDKLVSSGFRGSITRGFAASDEPNVAVCLMPGTELAFESHVESLAAWQGGAARNFGQKVARFRQFNLENPMAHHDAIEFADGETVLVTDLREGQHATVLQLPAAGPSPHREAEETAATEESMNA
jgi:hypothetical protein